MDAFNEGYSALQVLPRKGVFFAVLGFRAMADAVGKDRLEQIEIQSPQLRRWFVISPARCWRTDGRMIRVLRC